MNYITALYSRQDIMSNVEGLKNIKHLVVLNAESVLGSMVAIKFALMGVPEITLCINEEEQLENHRFIYEDHPGNPATVGYNSRLKLNTFEYIASRRVFNPHNFISKELVNKCVDETMSLNKLVLPKLEKYREDYLDVLNSLVVLNNRWTSEFFESEVPGEEGTLIIECLENSTRIHNPAVNFSIYLESYEGTGDVELFIEKDPYSGDEPDMDRDILFKKKQGIFNPCQLVGLFCNHIIHNGFERGEKETFTVSTKNVFDTFFSNENLITFEEGETVDTGVSFNLEDFEEIAI